MKSKSAAGLLLLLIYSLTSCNIRDGVNMEDCIRRMRIELRWIQTQPLKEQESVNVEIIPDSDESEYEISSDVYGVTVDMMVGNYTIVGWESPVNATIDVNNRTVSVNTSSDGIAIEPGFFNAGSTRTNVTLSEDDFVIPLPMYRQVRPLVIELNFTGAGVPLVEEIEGMLTGITVERDLANGFPPVNGINRPAAIRNGKIDYPFSSIEQEGEGIWYESRRNLLGIDGNTTQNLSLNITYNDDLLPTTRVTTEVSFDLTEQLAEFHTKDVYEPWYVVLTINLGISLDVEIVDWIAGPESWLIAQ